MRKLIPILMTHTPSKRCLKVKCSITILIVIAIVSGHPIIAIMANLIWVWADDD